METTVLPISYYDESGPACTEATLEAAYRRAKELGIKHVVVSSNTGETGAKAVQRMEGCTVTVVTHSVGFRGPNVNDLDPVMAEAITAGGGQIVTTTHAFGGIGRAVRRKLSAYQVDEIIAFALRTFGQGTKVCAEITIMAADAGKIPAGESIIAIGGTGKGVDTAWVLLSAHAQDLFDLRMLELICKPSCWR